MTDSMNYIEPQPQVDKRRLRRRKALWRKLGLGIILFFLVSFATLSVLTGSISNACRTLGMGIGFVSARVRHAPPFHGKKEVNILLLGADVTFGSGSRTDTIKLIHVDLEKQRIGMMSIPRDTWVELPNNGHGRINTAHALGGKEREKCITMAETTVSKLLTDLTGEPIVIDYYIRIQTDKFVQLVDGLGGIDLDVEKKMDYEDPSQNLFIHLEPGMQHLNGEQAMGYVRFRHDAEGDYGRIRRQDQFIQTMAAKLRNQKEVNLSLAKAVMNMVSTDLTANDLIAVKRLVSTVGMDGIESTQLPTVPTRKGRAQVVEVEDTVAAACAIRETLHGARPTVAVLNGTARAGLARDTSDLIREDAYNVVGVGVTKTPSTNSAVFAKLKHRAEAEALALQLGLTLPVNTQTPPPAAELSPIADHAQVTPAAQITVVLGSDYQMPSTTQAASIAQ